MKCHIALILAVITSGSNSSITTKHGQIFQPKTKLHQTTLVPDPLNNMGSSPSFPNDMFKMNEEKQ